MRWLVVLLALTGCDRVLGLEPVTSTPDASADAGPSLYATVVLEDRPLAYWRLGTASVTSAYDDSTKGNSGVFSGGVRPGAAGALVGDPDTATSFDGVDDSIIAGGPFFFEGTARFTIEAWVKPSPGPDPVGVISKATEDASGASRIGYQLYSRTDAIGFERSDGVDVQDVHTDALPAGTWSYVAVTFDGLTLTLYIDAAVRATSESGLSMLASNAAFAIGARNGGVQSFFAGAIDEVAVYDRDLTAAQIERNRRVALGQ